MNVQGEWLTGLESDPIERFFSKLKQRCRGATRDDKVADIVLAMVQPAAVRL